MVGWAWFSLWSLISGFCRRSDIILFGICRALQGIGPAFLVPNAIALMGTAFPVGVKRNTAFACFGAAGPTGAAAGAAFAALVSEFLSWHWCFWIHSIICACLIAVSFFLIPAANRLIQPLVDPTFDYLGSVTGVAGLVLVNFAFNQAPLTGWGEPYVLVLLVLGVLSLAAFFWVELYLTSQPLFPIRDLQPEAIFVLACVFAGWSSHGIWAYYLYLFLEHLRGHSALLTSAETSPVAATGLLFAFLTVWLVRRIAVSWVMLISMVLFVLGSMLLALVPLEQTYWAQTFVSVLLMPGAMNLSFPAATILLSSALPKEKQGIAASLVTTMVNYSISCGLGLAGSIHRETITHASERQGINGPPEPLSLSTPELVAVRLEGLKAVYWFAVGLSGLGVVVAGIFVIMARPRVRIPDQPCRCRACRRMSRQLNEMRAQDTCR
jgi:MFS family permease